jgi:tetratricopeptide (TPR) repeat protein
METIKRQPISVFYSYDENDKDLRDQLDKHLANLERQQLIKGWHDQDIRAGTEWKSAINEHLDTAQIILLLISADFIASDYRYSIEMKRALERHNSGDAFVIPVLLRSCDIDGPPFNQLDFLPSNGKPVKTWPNDDDAFRDVAAGIRKVVQEFLPRTREQWLDEGNRYHKAKLYEKALVAYERALRLDVNYARAQRNKGDALYDLRRYTEALDAYTIALRLDPASARVHRNMADILAHLGRHNESLDTYKRAIQLAPTARLYNEEGDVLFRLKHYEEALRVYEQAIQLNPNFVYAWNNKGNALLRLKRFQDAIAAYERASQLDPTFALPYNNKGRALFYLGRYRESLIAYEQALRIDPNFAAVYINYAGTLEKLSMTQEAAVARDKAQELKNRKASNQT